MRVNGASLWVVGWLVILLSLTLQPVPGTADPSDRISLGCLVCGDRGTADAALNLLFFVPLGLAFARRPRGALEALLTGAAFSACVEGLQVFVPGRYPTFGDVFWNGLGAMAGVLALRAALRHLRRPFPSAGIAAALFVGGGLLLGGCSLAHAPTGSPYYGQWTADLGHMPRYGGTLISAELDGRPIPNTRFRDAMDARARLAGDWSITARVVKGPPPTAVSPIVSVYDSLEAEILLLGAHDDDLVLRERTRAAALLLDHPDLRLPGALAPFEVGDTVRISGRAVGPGRCLSVGDDETCGLGVTPGRTWGLLLYLEGLTENERRTLDTLWLFALLFVVGAASASWRAVATDAALIVALVAAGIVLTRLDVPPLWEWAGALAGLVVGQTGIVLARRLFVDGLG